MIITGRIIYSLFTFYMLLVLLNWTSPVLQLEMESGRWAWIKKITNPPINFMKKYVQPIGPVEISPVVVLFLLWFFRSLIINGLSVA